VCHTLGYNNGFFAQDPRATKMGGLVDLRSEKDVNFKNKIESYGDEGGKQRR
jgi:hypothetical protein